MKEWISKLTWAIEFDDPHGSDVEVEPRCSPVPSDISWKHKLVAKVRLG